MNAKNIKISVGTVTDNEDGSCSVNVTIADTSKSEIAIAVSAMLADISTALADGKLSLAETVQIVADATNCINKIKK